MTYYHHWFEEFVKSKHIYLCSFFSNEGSFSHLFNSLDGHSPDKAGRSEVGRRSVGGRSAVGERRSEVGRRLVGGWSEVDRAPVERRSEVGRGSVGRRSEVGRRSVGRRSEVGRSVGGFDLENFRSDSFSIRTFCIESSRFRARVARGGLPSEITLPGEASSQ